MNIEKARALMKQKLPIDRYNHTLRVAETAVKLANLYDIHAKYVELAAIFHDIAKYWPREELKKVIQQSSLPKDLLNYHHELWHGPVGSIIIKEEYEIEHTDIRRAIQYHTTGRSGMSMIELIIFVADYIEPGRDIPDVNDVREQAPKNIVKAAWMVSSRTIQYLINKRVTIYPDTLFAYNDLTERVKQSVS